MTPQEIAASDLDAAVAAVEGWTWFWSKHDYWNITRPDGSGLSTYGSVWTPYDPHTGAKRQTPTHPIGRELSYTPTTDPAEAMRLMEKYRVVLFPPGAGGNTTENWAAFAAGDDSYCYGETPAEAICRVVVRTAK